MAEFPASLIPTDHQHSPPADNDFELPVEVPSPVCRTKSVGALAWLVRATSFLSHSFLKYGYNEARPSAPDVRQEMQRELFCDQILA